MAHQLHELVGNCIEKNINEFSDCKIVKDPACSGKQHIPLFYTTIKSRKTKYCNVDLLIIKNAKIKVIIEIEESNCKPTQICGKFLTSALCSCYIHPLENNKPIEMDNDVVFIQILNTNKLPKASSKFAQWENLEEAINNILPIGKINKYKLIYGSIADFKDLNKDKCIEIAKYLEKVLIK